MAQNPKPVVSHRPDTDLKDHQQKVENLLKGQSTHAQVVQKELEQKAIDNTKQVVDNLPQPGHMTADLLMQYQRNEHLFLGPENKDPYEHLRMTPQQHYERRLKAARMGQPIQ